MIICGLSIAAYPLVITSYWGLACVSAIFGLSLASSYSYTPAILMELMPIDRFTVAYGLILLSQGLGHLIGPPIGGKLLFSIWAIQLCSGYLFLAYFDDFLPHLLTYFTFKTNIFDLFRAQYSSCSILMIKKRAMLVYKYVSLKVVSCHNKLC